MAMRLAMIPRFDSLEHIYKMGVKKLFQIKGGRRNGGSRPTSYVLAATLWLRRT